MTTHETAAADRRAAARSIHAADQAAKALANLACDLKRHAEKAELAAESINTIVPALETRWVETPLWMPDDLAALRAEAERTAYDAAKALQHAVTQLAWLMANTATGSEIEVRDGFEYGTSPGK